MERMMLVLLLFLISGVLPKSADDLDKEIGPVIYTTLQGEGGGELIQNTCLSGNSLTKSGVEIPISTVYRHGERNILNPGTKDPWRDLKYWPGGYGQLIPLGISHHYQLGQWLRQRYSHLIPNGKYEANIIRVQSTDSDRTLQSAAANLAGMFPPVADQIWNQDIIWQPISIHTIPKKLDKVLAMEAPCARYNELYNTLLDSEEIKKINLKYQDLYKYLAENYGRTVTGPAETSWVNINFIIEESLNYTLPNWTHSVYPDKMKEPTAIHFLMPTWTREMMRLKAGPLLKEILETMDNKLNDSKEVRLRAFSVYSTHDDILVNLLNTLGIYNGKPPTFGSLLMIELRLNAQKTPVVTFLYKNTTDAFEEPNLLEHDQCRGACPLARLKELCKDVVPDDWDRECKNKHPTFDYLYPTKNESPFVEPAFSENDALK